MLTEDEAAGAACSCNYRGLIPEEDSQDNRQSSFT